MCHYQPWEENSPEHELFTMDGNSLDELQALAEARLATLEARVVMIERKLELMEERLLFVRKGLYFVCACLFALMAAFADDVISFCDALKIQSKVETSNGKEK
ncbi:hypothetical protein ACOSQ3_009663 [Xanthoceras sorbifolium]